MNIRNTPAAAGSEYVKNTVALQRSGGLDFSRVLATKTGTVRDRAGGEPVHFSAHAMARMKSRNITMSSAVMQRLDKAVAGAEQKGAKDSLVVLSDLAFIVNIPNRTVVTAMDGVHARERVFTNIDSTVIA